MRWLRKTSPELLTEGHIFKAITSLAAPMLAGAVLQNTQSLIDLFWVGRLGPSAIASVAMAATIMMVLFPMLMGLSTGTIALVARATGARKPEEAGLATSQSLILAMVFGGMSALLGLVGADPLFRILGASPDVTAQGGEFLRILLLGGITGQRQLFLLLTTITFPQWRQLHFCHKWVGNWWLADTLGEGKNQGIILPPGGGSPRHFVSPPFCFRSFACSAR